MGTVGISFGSPTSGQGFDVATTVSQITTNMQAVETPWKNQLTLLQSEDTAYTTLGTDLSNLSTSLSALTNVGGILNSMDGSSSNTNVVQLLSAGTTAIAGSHTIVVNSLAQTASYYSEDFANSSDLINGSLTLTVNGGTAQTINTDSGGDTLAQFAADINDADTGVTANVITDAGGQRLSLTSNTSGAVGNFTISSTLADATNPSNTIGFTQPQTGTDASFTVDGISETSSSNTVTNAIPGVSFQLLSAAPTSPVQVEITNDNSDIETAVNTFVTDYNQAVTDMNAQEGNDSSGSAEPLYGSPTLALLQEQLASAASFVQSSGSGSVTSLTQLGISLNDDGTMTLDTSALDSTLNSNFQDVVNFFQPSATTPSFGDNFTTAVNNLGNSAPDGAVYLALQADSSTESTLNTNITNENTYITQQTATLTTELNQANYTLTEIPSQIDEINELYSAVTGYNANEQ
ncbi:MAG TPA: flagellar filament capping protein FliD [Acidobacteriaceae bacterium]|jgi:flagellar hook-associated protein 2|nr:flagellar filament capping protein FliD [Acidobacteriaceae bacterium]